MLTKEETEKLFADSIGDFYTESMLADTLAVSEDELRDSDQYVSLVTSDGVRVYPAVQFDADGEVPKELRSVVDKLNSYYDNTDGWSAMFWLTGRIDQSDDKSPTYMEILHREGPYHVERKIREMIGRREAGQ